MAGFRNEQLLKLSYMIGGIYDLTLGFGLFFFSDFLISFFNISKPDNMLFAYTSGLFLFTVGYYLIYAASHEPENFLFIGFGSAFVRISFTVIVLITWLDGGIEGLYLVVGFMDLFTGILLLIPVLKTKTFSIKSIW